MTVAYNAMAESYEKVTVLGKPMLFSGCRIDRKTLPKGMYLYEVRHDDDGRGDPCQIAQWVLVNHWGTLISNEPIKLVPSTRIDNAYLDIDPEKDWNYEGEECTLLEYMQEHPPKNKEKSHER